MNTYLKLALLALCSTQASALEFSDKPHPELTRIEKEEQENIYRHRDIYMLSGKPDTKVQLSLKLKPIKAENLFLAYSQKMFWDLGKRSSPFNDINYNPELFYDWLREEKALKLIRVGIEHRSNGKKDLDSRSYDAVFTELTQEFSLGKYYVLWDIRLFHVYDIDWRYNRDIQNYMGFWATSFHLNGLIEDILPAKGEMDLMLYPGGKFGNKIGNGAMEFNIKYRIRLFGVMPYLMAQYYYGSMESLARYADRTHGYRLGFML